MNSADNRRTLALGGGKYILGSRMRAGDEVSTQVLARPGRYKQVRDNLRVKEVALGDGERRQRYVVCHNPTEETRQREHRAKLIADQAAVLRAVFALPRLVGRVVTDDVALSPFAVAEGDLLDAQVVAHLLVAARAREHLRPALVAGR